MNIVVIVPTYNERDNIAELLAQLQTVFGRLDHDMQVLVVDDNSPDGTQQVVRAQQTAMPNLHMICGDKAGLGAAYIRGMRHALDVLRADVVFEMDADFSHKPDDIPRLLHAIEDGADFVIGSRYVSGGSIPREWGVLRRLNSLFGNIVARFLAGIYSVRDCTAGFRAIRSGLLAQIDLSALRVQGYAFQIALLYEAVLRGARIVEVPVEFVERTRGDSKLGVSDIVEFLQSALWLRFRSSATFIKFALVGASGVVVNLGAFALLLGLGVNKFIASPIAIELSIIWNFLFNNYWTFRWRKSRDRTRIKGLKFNAVSFASLAVSYVTFVALSLAFPDVAPHWHQLAGIVPAALINYFLNSYWTFRHDPQA
ncbi:MAG: glycosyltransferase family 2 protein [Gammaproteobacteria bacterium]|nr:glycosyltransferase family 2 protein [Gammaproteobacteria bacterium]